MGWEKKSQDDLEEQIGALNVCYNRLTFQSGRIWRLKVTSSSMDIVNPTDWVPKLQSFRDSSNSLLIWVVLSVNKVELCYSLVLVHWNWVIYKQQKLVTYRCRGWQVQGQDTSGFGVWWRAIPCRWCLVCPHVVEGVATLPSCSSHIQRPHFFNCHTGDLISTLELWASTNIQTIPFIKQKKKKRSDLYSVRAEPLPKVRSVMPYLDISIFLPVKERL